MIRPFGATLTPREIELLGLIAGGATHAKAAYDMSISVLTVKTFVSHITKKLDVGNVMHGLSLLDDYRPGWRPRLRLPGDVPVRSRYIEDIPEPTVTERIEET